VEKSTTSQHWFVRFDTIADEGAAWAFALGVITKPANAKKRPRILLFIYLPFESRDMAAAYRQ
jgi:hypothetical protein